MKILKVMNLRSNRGGLTGAVMELATSLRKEGFSLDIVSIHGKIRERIKNIAKIIKGAKNYDLIMATGCADYGFLPIAIGVVAGRIHKKRILVDFHSGYPEPFMQHFGRLVKIFLGNIPVTVASGYLFDIFKKYKLNVFLMPYHFHYDAFPERSNKFEWNKKIMWAASFQFMYDPETALKACSLVLGKRQDVEFHFFGEGKLLKNLSKKYSHKNIFFKGFIPRSELLPQYQQYCAFLNTSFGDNFPLRLVEASFYELLVISARCSGVATIYNDKECLFFEKGDYVKLSEHILGVLEGQHFYDPFRNNMHKKIMSFTWEKVRDKWLSLLNENKTK